MSAAAVTEHYVSPWRIDITVRDGVRSPLSRTALARAAAAALGAAGAPAPASLGLILTDDREMARLNRKAMGRRLPTDVLAFPLLERSAYPLHPGQAPEPRTGDRVAPDFHVPPGRRPQLGDVVVSVERAVAQAGAGRGGQTGTVAWAPSDELRLLVTHGVLHVCGWDHATPAEEAAMRALERRLLGGG